MIALKPHVHGQAEKEDTPAERAFEASLTGLVGTYQAHATLKTHIWALPMCGCQ